MLKDHHYNLLSQLVTEHRSLWRIQKYYLKNAKGCKRCQDFFKKLANDKQRHIQDLLKLWKEHFILIFLLILLLVPFITFAYCSLCVGGVLVLTFFGYELGVKKIVLGFLIGALAVVFGEWLNRFIKIKIFKGQEFLIIVLTFIFTYLPVKNYIFNYYSLYLPNLGINTPILIDKSLLSGIFGGLLVYIAPFISKFITQKRGKTILFQRIIVTLILLIIFGLILQFI